MAEKLYFISCQLPQLTKQYFSAILGNFCGLRDAKRKSCYVLTPSYPSVVLDSFFEKTIGKGAHTIEHGLKKICFQVMRGDRVDLLQNASKKAYQCN